MKKICAVTTIYKTMDWFVVDSMRNLSNNGYDITLLCDMNDEFIEKNSDYAKCIDFKMSRGVSAGEIIPNIVKMYKIFKKEKFDMIFYTSPNASLYASVAAALARVKIRYYSQCGLRYVSFSGLKKIIFKSVEKITCMFSNEIRAQSPLNLKFAETEGLYKKGMAKVIGIGGTIGVDLNEYNIDKKEEERNKIFQKYNIPDDAFVYGFVGRVNADKGVNELLEAFKNSSDKSDYLILVGMMDDVNPVSQELIKWAQESENVIFTGNVDSHDVWKYMSSFDVLTHPTYREGFGKVLQEAMALGVPVITTDIPGPSEVVAGGKCGVLVPAHDSCALAKAMKELKNDKEKQKFLSKLERERVEKYFDRPIMLKNILDDINEVFK